MSLVFIPAVGVVNRKGLLFAVTVGNASALLGTTFSSYQKEGRTLVRAADYTLPASVAAVTATTLGLHGLPMPRMEPINMTRVGPNEWEVAEALRTDLDNPRSMQLLRENFARAMTRMSARAAFTLSRVWSASSCGARGETEY